MQRVYRNRDKPLYGRIGNVRRQRYRGISNHRRRKVHVDRDAGDCQQRNGPISSGVVKTFQTDPASTTIIAGGAEVTFHRRLSFDSDEGAIYFEKICISRMIFSDTSPAELLFQSLNRGTDEYVTKFFLHQGLRIPEGHLHQLTALKKEKTRCDQCAGRALFKFTPRCVPPCFRVRS